MTVQAVLPTADPGVPATPASVGHSTQALVALLIGGPEAQGTTGRGDQPTPAPADRLTLVQVEHAIPAPAARATRDQAEPARPARQCANEWWKVSIESPAPSLKPNPSIERTPKSQLRCLSVAAHVERWAP